MSRFRAAMIAMGSGAAAWMLAGSALSAGYLAPESVPATLRILPPPPAAHSRRQADDRAVFKATRALKGSPRWTLAASDAVISSDALMADFACALGVKITPAEAPTLYAMFGRMLIDIRLVVDPPKDHYARHRPYLDQTGEICVARSDLLDKTPSYPSGHSTLGWSWAMILAELAPDRSTEILMRGRVYGESRVVCGVHYPTDIEAGRTNGAALIAALHGGAEFRADLEKARAEIAAARKAGPGLMSDAGQCTIEADAAAQRLW